MTDTNKLKELAERAQISRGGEWYNEGDCCWWTGRPDEGDFMAAANPQAILGLIAEIEENESVINVWRGRTQRAEAEVERLRTRLEIDERTPYDGIACRDETIKGLDEKCDRLKAENEALRKQLEQVHPFQFAGPIEGPDLKCSACGGYHYGLPPGMPCPKSAAIAQDAALEGGGK